MGRRLLRKSAKNRKATAPSRTVRRWSIAHTVATREPTAASMARLSCQQATSPPVPSAELTSLRARPHPASPRPCRAQGSPVHPARPHSPGSWPRPPAAAPSELPFSPPPFPGPRPQAGGAALRKAWHRVRGRTRTALGTGQARRLVLCYLESPSLPETTWGSWVDGASPQKRDRHSGCVFQSPSLIQRLEPCLVNSRDSSSTWHFLGVSLSARQHARVCA